MVLWVSVRLNGDDGNTNPENDDQALLDGLLQMQHHIDRSFIQIFNEKARLDRRIYSLNNCFVSMNANIRNIAEHSVSIKQNIRIVLCCLAYWSHYDHHDGHVCEFGSLSGAIADKNHTGHTYHRYSTSSMNMHSLTSLADVSSL